MRPFHLPGLRAGTLENGLRILSMSRGQVPLVSVCLVIDAGESRTAAGKEGIAVLTGDALHGGTEKRTASELAEGLERLGTGLAVSTSWDATAIRFTCVAEHVGEVLDLLAEVTRTPAFPPDELETTRQQRLASIRQRKMDPGSLADDELDRRVFGPDHPYGRPLAGSEESISSIVRDESATFVSTNYGPIGGGLVLVGDLSEGQVGTLAEERFSDWSVGDRIRGGVPKPLGPQSRSVVVVDRPGAVQSELRIGHPAPRRGHPDEIPLSVSNAVLGGAFTSRLNVSLREKHGFTYGARSSFAFRRDGGDFMVRTAVQTEVTAPALREAVAVLEMFVEEGPSAEELARARDYISGVFPLRMETTAQLASRLAELVVFDLPDDHHHTYRDRVRAVEVDVATEAVRTHIRPHETAIVVVGDAERVVPELEDLGLGAVEVTDPRR